MGEAMATAKAGCACGWTVEGPEDIVVDAVIEHGRKIHNMVATREDVLAQIRAPRTTDAAGSTGSAA